MMKYTGLKSHTIRGIYDSTEKRIEGFTTEWTYGLRDKQLDFHTDEDLWIEDITLGGHTAKGAHFASEGHTTGGTYDRGVIRLRDRLL